MVDSTINGLVDLRREEERGFRIVSNFWFEHNYSPKTNTGGEADVGVKREKGRVKTSSFGYLLSINR